MNLIFLYLILLMKMNLITIGKLRFLWTIHNFLNFLYQQEYIYNKFNN